VGVVGKARADPDLDLLGGAFAPTRFGTFLKIDAMRH